MEKIPDNKELSEKVLESLSKVRPENETNKRFVLSKEDFSKERLAAVKEEVEEMKEKYPEVLSLCMFGSMVKGTAHEGSDIDAYLYIDSAKAAERKGVTEEEILETHERLDEVYLTKEVAKLYILEFRNGLKEKADLEDNDVEHIRSRPISEKIINDEIKALTDYYAEKENHGQNTDKYYDDLDEWTKNKPKAGAEIDVLVEHEKNKPERPKYPTMVMASLGPMFHLEVGGGIRKYRKMFVDKLVELGPLGEKIWTDTIRSTEIMENNLSTDESKRYPRTLEDAVRVYSPESKKDQQAQLSSEEKWREKQKEIEQVTDATGRGIDGGIKETVVAFNMNEIPTSQSCEGHDEVEGGHRPWPWVEVAASDEPAEKFVGEMEAFTKAAQENNISLENLKRGHPEEIYWTLRKEISQSPVTPEYEAWEKRNEELHIRVVGLLEEFYKNRNVEMDIQLHAEESKGGSFEISSEREALNKFLSSELTDEEKKSLLDKLPKRQKEMRDFTEFLKGRYLGNEL